MSLKIKDLERLQDEPHDGSQVSWPLNMIGLFAGLLTDQEVDEMLATIYAARDRDVPRPFSLDD